MRYFKYWNRPDKLYTRIGKFEPNLSSSAPGNIGDRRNKDFGEYMRFEKWYNRPVKGKKLYWKILSKPSQLQ